MTLAHLAYWPVVKPVMWITILCVMICVTQTKGSVINFHSDPATIKQGLTSTLTLNCFLSDTNLAIIGKRDVIPSTSHDAITDLDLTPRKDELSPRTVQQTADDVMLLTSLVITKDGKDIASVNIATDANVMDGSSNIHVSGSVRGNSGRTGYIKLVISNPRADQIGEFSCEANAVGSNGHGVIFATTLEVYSTAPSLADLVSVVGELSRENAQLKQQNQVLGSKVDALEQSLENLRNKSNEMVFFNARILDYPHYAADDVVVFDNVLDNLGGDYNVTSGQFTCRVPGFYHFSLGCMSENDKSVTLELMYNDQVEFYIHGVSGHGFQASANTATIQLAEGDVVKIVACYDSKIDGPFCNFSGHLIHSL